MNPEPQEMQTNAASSTPSRWRRLNWRLTLLGIAILLAGAVIGASISAMVAQRDLLNRFRHPEGVAPMVADQMMHELALSSDQAAKVQSIIEKRMQKISEIREGVRPKIDEQFSLMQKEVAALLNKDQAKWWEERIKEAQRFRPPPPGGPPEGPYGGPPPPPPGGPFGPGFGPPPPRGPQGRRFGPPPQ